MPKFFDHNRICGMGTNPPMSFTDADLVWLCSSAESSPFSLREIKDWLGYDSKLTDDVPAYDDAIMLAKHNGFFAFNAHFGGCGNYYIMSREVAAVLAFCVIYTLWRAYVGACAVIAALSLVHPAVIVLMLAVVASMAVRVR